MDTIAASQSKYDKARSVGGSIEINYSIDTILNHFGAYRPTKNTQSKVS